MAKSFKSIAELDLGNDVSAAVTPEFYKALLNEALAIGESVVLIKEEITSNCGSPSLSERIDVKQSIPSDSMAKLERQTQAGYRTAIVLHDAEEGLRFLESKGYERCLRTSSGSIAVIQGWEAWLDQHLPDAHGAIVFGHDYEPAFVFKNADWK